jgi:hypothetical protein
MSVRSAYSKCTRQLADELLRPVTGNIDEGDPAFLLGEATNDRFADAGAAAGDEDYLPVQVGVYRSHPILPRFRPTGPS